MRLNNYFLQPCQGGIVSHDELEARVKFNESTTAKDGSTKNMASNLAVFKCGRMTGKTRGDSGSLVCDYQGKAIGMYIVGPNRHVDPFVMTANQEENGAAAHRIVCLRVDNRRRVISWRNRGS